MSGQLPSADPLALVVGAGPAGLMAADLLSAAGVWVLLADQMPRPGRKLLMAGRGGLNLTHSEPAEKLLSRYGPAAPHLFPFISSFDAGAVRAWAAGLGQETFVGSSGRVFPVAMKASPLLRAWLERLGAQGVDLAPRTVWRGREPDGTFLFSGHDPVKPAVAILACGGASWPRLGSDGAWVQTLATSGLPVMPLQADNCGLLVPWSASFAGRWAGQPLKPVALSIQGQRARGEVMLTRLGLEGGAVYALGRPARELAGTLNHVPLAIDLLPQFSLTDVIAQTSKPRGARSLTGWLARLKGMAQAPAAFAREAANLAGLDLAAMAPDALARFLKAVPLRATGLMGLDRAISTSGGLDWPALGPDLSVTGWPGVFAAGEMINWDAPTGGYLLHACLATGRAAALGALKYLGR